MKKVTLLLVLFISVFSQAQTKLFVDPEFNTIAKQHKTIAILPFEVTIKLRPKQMKDISQEQLATMEKKEGISIQNAMYSWFLKRKKRGKLKVVVQDPSKTRVLLKKNKIDLETTTKEELAKILGVDAVVSGTIQTNKPMSEEASIALDIFLGVRTPTNSAVVNISVTNGLDGKLLWNYNKKIRGSVGSTNEDLVNILMRKTSRRLAYTKMK